MTRIVLAAIVAAAIAVPGISGADHGGEAFSQSGTLEHANLLAINGEKYAAEAAACDPAGAANGSDGIWYDITGYAGHTATLAPTGPTGQTEDFDAYFFKKNDAGECVAATLDPKVDSNMAEGFIEAANPLIGTATEVGVVPADAQYIFVAYFFGPPNGTFTLSIA